jgi:hypothetical protein
VSGDTPVTRGTLTGMHVPPNFSFETELGIPGTDAGRPAKPFAGSITFAGSILALFFTPNRKTPKICRFDQIWGGGVGGGGGVC